MTPSDRIKHIKDISEALGKEDRSLIDLTLKQFGLSPWSRNHYWEGSLQSYVLYMLEDIDDISDESLLELAKHIGAVPELERVETPSFWKPDQPRVFISHLAEIKSKAVNLSKALEEYSIISFVAHEDIEPTKEWQIEIEIALTTMDALVVLLSPGFKESNWTDQEVGVAVGRGVPIVPVKIELDPYGFIGKYQALQGKGKIPVKVASEIFEILIEKPNIGSKITGGIVEVFANSVSGSYAKRNMDWLEKSKHLTPTMVERLRNAIKENDQFNYASDVPERLENLIKRIGS
jgi:TIR domain-containing protein